MDPNTKILFLSSLQSRSQIIYWVIFGMVVIVATYFIAGYLVEIYEGVLDEQVLVLDFVRKAPTHKLVDVSKETNTKGWKTYRNEKYGFEFKYPSDWENPVDGDRVISFGIATPDNFEGIKLRITITSLGTKTLDQVISDQGSQYGISLRDIEKTTLDGAEVRKFIENRQGGFTAYDLYAVHGGYIYKMWYGNRFGGDPVPLTAAQIQVVFSTFKFIEP